MGQLWGRGLERKEKKQIVGDDQIQKQINSGQVKLGGQHIDNSKIQHINMHPGTNKIRKLYLGNNQIQDQGIYFFKQAKWSNLTQLYLCLLQTYSARNRLGDKGCKYLSSASFIQIQSLVLRDNKIGHVGVNHLYKGYWKCLIRIDFQGNKIGVNSIGWLIKSNWIKIKDLILCINSFIYHSITQKFIKCKNYYFLK